MVQCHKHNTNALRYSEKWPSCGGSSQQHCSMECWLSWRTIHSAENISGFLMLMQMQIWLHSRGKCWSLLIYSTWHGIEHIATVWTQCSPSSPQAVPPTPKMPFHQFLKRPLPYLLDPCYCLQYWINCLHKWAEWNVPLSLQWFSTSAGHSGLLSLARWN